MHPLRVVLGDTHKCVRDAHLISQIIHTYLKHLDDDRPDVFEAWDDRTMSEAI